MFKKLHDKLGLIIGQQAIISQEVLAIRRDIRELKDYVISGQVDIETVLDSIDKKVDKVPNEVTKKFRF